MTIFVIALMSAVVIGMLQMITEEIQVMRNQVCSTLAIEIAEAGLNDALSELRADSDWDSGFSDKAFENGLYTTTVSGSLPNLTLESTGTSPQGFISIIQADITVGSSGPPYVIRIDSLRINES